jgi:hypothetical protein
MAFRINELSWGQLHDATLVRLECRWEDGCTTVHLRTGVSSFPEAQIVANGARRIECPRLHPWGASVSINEVRGPVTLPDEQGSRLEIEMQTGDVIVLEAEAFRLMGV